jgi:hypothetical protein
MIGLLMTLVEWAVKLAVLLVVLTVRAIAATYGATERAIHAHRLANDPAADRAASQVIAGAIVAAGLGVLILIASLTGGGGATGPSTGTHGSGSEAATHGVPIDESATGGAAGLLLAETDRATPLRLRLRLRGRRRVARANRRARQRAAVLAAATPTPTPTSTPTQAPSCDSNYAGACLAPDAYDYDCAGGSGDGPEYTGEVRVVGADHYDLDRDGDGVACEPY